MVAMGYGQVQKEQTTFVDNVDGGYNLQAKVGYGALGCRPGFYTVRVGHRCLLAPVPRLRSVSDKVVRLSKAFYG